MARLPEPKVHLHSYYTAKVTRIFNKLAGVSVVAQHTEPASEVLPYHVGNGLSPGSSISNLAPCLWTWASSGRWPRCVGPCTHAGDLKEVSLASVWPSSGHCDHWGVNKQMEDSVSLFSLFWPFKKIDENL